jgi:hypothetical protein
MTTTTPTARRPGIAASPFDEATQVVTFGNAVWMVWVWALAPLATAAIVFLIQRYGTVDQSMFDSLFAGWQLWLVFAAGVITVTVLLPMLVTNGATRARVAAAAATSMFLVALAATCVVVAGFALESFAYDRGGWPQLIDGTEVHGVTDIAALGVEHLVGGMAFFTSGWLVGLGFYRYGNDGGLPMIPPALVPAFLVGLLLNSRLGPIDVQVFDEGTVPLWAGVLGSLVVIAIGVAVARALTRTTPIKA